MTEFANPALLNRTHAMSVLNVSALNFHADRERLFNELHTRPFPVVQEGSSVSQLALLHHGQQPPLPAGGPAFCRVPTASQSQPGSDS